MKNQFLIDLSALNLTEEQVTSIDGAIQKAVSGELAKVETTKGKITLVPLGKEKGGIGDHTMGYRGI
jgi:hypothetical protein